MGVTITKITRDGQQWICVRGDKPNEVKYIPIRNDITNKDIIEGFNREFPGRNSKTWERIKRRK